MGSSSTVDTEQRMAESAKLEVERPHAAQQAWQLHPASSRTPTPQVFISTRHGSWVMSRLSENGCPWDAVFHTRFSDKLRNVLPRRVLKWMMEQQVNRWFNHENYGLEPYNK